MSDEEKEAIEEIKKDDEYYDILENIKQNKYNMCNVEKLMRDSTNGNYTEYEIAESIVYFVNLIEKQQKEIENLKEQNKNLNWYFENQKDNFVHKDKIKAKIEEYKKEAQIRINVINNGVLDEKTLEKARIELSIIEEIITDLQSLLEEKE